METSSPYHSSGGQIGPYTILKKIGRGGLGDVFLVNDPICHRHVCLKLLRPDIDSLKYDARRFLEDARIMASVVHPTIIPIYTVSTDTSYPYYVMPYIEGETLRKVLHKSYLSARSGQQGCSLTALCHIFLQITRGVCHAHSLDIVHKDLKPSNILISSDESAYILDWAPSRESTEYASKTLLISGTIPYLAPEITTGIAHSVTTDIYALGLILYEMLTWRYPFKRSTLTTYLENWEREAIVDPRIVCPQRGISYGLSHIVSTCLASDPERRYRTVRQIIDDLEQELRDWPKEEDVPATCTRAHASMAEEAKHLFREVEVLSSRKQKAGFFQALKKYENTPFSPLEVLGQSLFFEKFRDNKSEMRTIWTLLSEFRHHTLAAVLEKDLFRRLSQVNKPSSCRAVFLAMTAIRFFPYYTMSQEVQVNIDATLSAIFPFAFIDNEKFTVWPQGIKYTAAAIHMGLLLEQPAVIAGMLDELTVLRTSPPPLIQQGILSLMAMESWAYAQQKLDLISHQFLDIQAISLLDILQQAINVCRGDSFNIPSLTSSLPKKMTVDRIFPFLVMFDMALQRGEEESVIALIHFLMVHHELDAHSLLRLDEYLIASYFLQRKWDDAEEVLTWHQQEGHESQFLSFLHTCLAYKKGGTLRPLPHQSTIKWSSLEKKEQYLAKKIISLFND